MITRSQIKKYEVSYILSLIYNNKIPVEYIHNIPKKKLAWFVIDEFNKGHLNNSFIENWEMYRG